jgi:hypothetical protein
MRRFNEHLQAGLDTINTAVADLNTRIPQSLPEALSPKQWQEWLSSIPNTIMESLGGVLTIIIGWVLGFVMMLVLLGVGIWLMQQTSGVVTSLVGGFSGGGVVPNVLGRTAQLVQQRLYLNRVNQRQELPSSVPKQLPPSGGQAHDERRQPKTEEGRKDP